VKHWNELGSKNPQLFREGWNKDPNNFRIMSPALNTWLGSVQASSGVR
jgi:hypothetical protein